MKFRDVLFWMHLIVAVVVGIVVLVMSVTGAILAFRPQILDAVERDVRQVAVPMQDVPRLSLQEIISKTRESFGEKKLSGVSISSDPSKSVTINFGKEGMLYVNPYTAQIIGKESKTQEFLEQVEVWHRWLGLQDEMRPVGHNIKGACNAAFLFLVISGFYLWWPKKWMWPGIKNIVLFNAKAQGKARDWNWHNVIGFWCAPALIIITLTGLIMSYAWANDLLYRMTGNEPPKKQNVERPKGEGKDKDRKDSKKNDQKDSKKNEATINLDAVALKADQRMPGWKLMNIRLPQRPDGPVMVMLEEKKTSYPQRSQLTLDGRTLDETKWEPVGEQNLGRKLRVFARYSHTGETAGVIGQTIAFLASIGAVVLVWTGFAMAWYRFTAWRGRKA